MTWNKRDITLMHRYYRKSCNRALSALLGRSVDSIEHKARRVGLNKAADYNRRDDMVIAANNRKRKLMVF